MNKSKRYRAPKQLAFAEIERILPKHIQLVTTKGKDEDQIVEEMLAVPMDKQILLDIFVGYKRGDYHHFTEDQVELKRLQQMLNSQYRGRRFDWMGDDMIAKMARKSIATESWKPRPTRSDEMKHRQVN